MKKECCKKCLREKDTDYWPDTNIPVFDCIDEKCSCHMQQTQKPWKFSVELWDDGDYVITGIGGILTGCMSRADAIAMASTLNGPSCESIFTLVESRTRADALREASEVAKNAYINCNLDGDDTDHRKGYEIAGKDIALSIEALGNKK